MSKNIYTPRRVLELTREFSLKGVALVEAREKAERRFHYEIAIACFNPRMNTATKGL